MTETRQVFVLNQAVKLTAIGKKPISPSQALELLKNLGVKI